MIKSKKRNVLLPIYIIGSYSYIGPIIRRFIENKNDNSFLIFGKKELEYMGTTFILKIIDPTPSERFMCVSKVVYQFGKGVLFVIDITNKESISRIQREIDSKITNGFKDDNSVFPVIFVIGIKGDINKKREISKEEAINFSNLHGYKYFECSALSGENIHEIFHYMIRDIFERRILLEEKQQELKKIHKCILF